MVFRITQIYTGMIIITTIMVLISTETKTISIIRTHNLTMVMETLSVTDIFMVMDTQMSIEQTSMVIKMTSMISIIMEMILNMETLLITEHMATEMFLIIM